jgi:hypothetical protein
MQQAVCLCRLNTGSWRSGYCQQEGLDHTRWLLQAAGQLLPGLMQGALR